MARDEHNKAAEHHEHAAKAHRSAADHHSKGDHAKAKNMRMLRSSIRRQPISTLTRLIRRVSNKSERKEARFAGPSFC